MSAARFGVGWSLIRSLGWDNEFLPDLDVVVAKIIALFDNIY